MIGALVLIVVPVASQSSELVSGVEEGIGQLREWAAGPPLNIGDDQVTSALDSGVAQLQERVSDIINIGLSGVTTIINGVVNAVLAVFLMFFFLKDGPRFLPWLRQQLPGRLSQDVPVVAGRSWAMLGSFVRSQAFVGLLDAVFIGIGLWLVGAPFLWPRHLWTVQGHQACVMHCFPPAERIPLGVEIHHKSETHGSAPNTDTRKGACFSAASVPASSVLQPVWLLQGAQQFQDALRDTTNEHYWLHLHAFIASL